MLESLGRSLGVVEAIAAQTRMEFVFSGRANHAGTTPMHLRHDAVAGAAEWIVAVGAHGAELLRDWWRRSARSKQNQARST